MTAHIKSSSLQQAIIINSLHLSPPYIAKEQDDLFVLLFCLLNRDLSANSWGKPFWKKQKMLRIFSRVTVTTVTLENGFAVFAFLQKGPPQLFPEHTAINPDLSIREQISADKASVVDKVLHILVYTGLCVAAVAVVNADLTAIFVERVSDGVQTR